MGEGGETDARRGGGEKKRGSSQKSIKKKTRDRSTVAPDSPIRVKYSSPVLLLLPLTLSHSTGPPSTHRLNFEIGSASLPALLPPPTPSSMDDDDDDGTCAHDASGVQAGESGLRFRGMPRWSLGCGRRVLKGAERCGQIGSSSRESPSCVVGQMYARTEASEEEASAAVGGRLSAAAAATTVARGASLALAATETETGR